MGRGPGRPVKTLGLSHGQDGCRSSSSSTPHLMGRNPGRPVKTRGPPVGCAERPIWRLHLMGRGPARLINLRDDGLRPGPAHQFFR